MYQICKGTLLLKTKMALFSKVDVDGKIIKLKWIEGLNAPKGINHIKG